jgi:heme exporter protein CcmB
MSKLNIFKQYSLLIKHSLRIELSNFQRLFSSFLFGITILFLFSFAIGDLDSNIKMKFILSEVFLCSFLVLQLVHQRIFLSDEEDRALDILVSSPLSLSILYLAKVSLSVLLSLLIIFPFVCFMQILHGVSLVNGFFLMLMLLMIVSLSALGVLLSQMTEKAVGRDLLFPLLYFPMTVPVLLSSVQASFCYWEIQNFDGFDLWLGLLIGTCIIYITLGILLFEELIV